MKKLLLALLLIVAVPIVWSCGSFAWLSFKLFVWNPYEMKQALRQYNGATYLFEETGHILTNTDQATVYYWSADPIEIVEASYEKTGLKFIPGTSQDDWRITAYDRKGLPEELPTSTDGLNNHHTICTEPDLFNGYYLTNNEAENARLEAEKAKVFGCITITLIKATHPTLCTLSMVFPGGQQGYSPTKTALYESCPRFPKQGTLIIFNYYLEGM